MQIVRWVLWSVVIALCVSASAFASSGQLPDALKCRSPLVLHLDSVSPQFDISILDLNLALQQAADIWNAAPVPLQVRIGRSEGIPVRFIYDHRQEMLDTLQPEAAYLSRQGDYLTEYRNEIAALIESLQQDAAELEEQASQQSRQAYNQAVEAYNSKVEEYLAAQEEFNAAIAEFNQRQEDLRDARIAHQEQFREQGLDIQAADYQGGWVTRNGVTKRAVNEVISVYKFSSQAALVTILAHEIGHALGLGHVGGDNSIMSRSIEEGGVGGPDRLSGNDLQALQAACAD